MFTELQTRKKLFVQMDIMEQQTLVMVWNKLKDTDKSNKSVHAKKEMNNRGISEAMIESAWESNHIIEFKVIGENQRMMVRSVDAYMCHYDVCRGGKKVGYSTHKELCNVCLVVDIKTGRLVTCYTCPVRMKKDYRNKNMYDTNYDYAMDVRAMLKGVA